MNTIQDLNMVLHQQLERLDNQDITKEELVHGFENQYKPKITGIEEEDE